MQVLKKLYIIQYEILVGSGYIRVVRISGELMLSCYQSILTIFCSLFEISRKISAEEEYGMTYLPYRVIQ